MDLKKSTLLKTCHKEFNKTTVNQLGNSKTFNIHPYTTETARSKPMNKKHRDLGQV